MNKLTNAIVILILVMLSLTPQVSFADDKDEDKSAILVVSFGTSMPEARKAIDNLVNSAKKNFPECEQRVHSESCSGTRSTQR